MPYYYYYYYYIIILLYYYIIIIILLLLLLVLLLLLFLLLLLIIIIIGFRVLGFGFRTRYRVRLPGFEVFMLCRCVCASLDSMRLVLSYVPRSENEFYLHVSSSDFLSNGWKFWNSFPIFEKFQMSISLRLLKRIPSSIFLLLRKNERDVVYSP